MKLDHVDRGAVPILACHWLKENADRYKYLGDEAEELHKKILEEPPETDAARENYCLFLEKLENNYFCVKYNIMSNGASICPTEYACFFVKNQYNMPISIELYCRVATRNQGTDPGQLAKVMTEQVGDSAALVMRILKSEEEKRRWIIEQAIQTPNTRQWIMDKLVSRYNLTRIATAGEDGNNPLLGVVIQEFKPRAKWAYFGVVMLVYLVISLIRFLFAIIAAGKLNSGAGVMLAIMILVLFFCGRSVTREIKSARMKKRINQDCSIIIRAIESMKQVKSQIAVARAQMEKDIRLYIEAYRGADQVNENAFPGYQVLGERDLSFAASDRAMLRINELLKSIEAPKKNVKFRHIIIFFFVLFLCLGDLGDLSIGGTGFWKDLAFTESDNPKTTSSGAKETQGGSETKEQQAEWYIAAPVCNVRATPGGDVIGTLDAGTLVNVSETMDDGKGTIWAMASTDSITGWVSRKVIRQVDIDEIPIVNASATSELSTKSNGVMSAGLATDGYLMTAWQEGVPGYGEGQQLRIEFGDSQSVASVRIINGNVKNAESYAENGRLKQVSVTADDGSTFVYDLEDEYNYTEGTLLVFESPVITTGLTFTINSVYQGSKYEDTCITELTAYRNRTAD